MFKKIFLLCGVGIITVLPIARENTEEEAVRIYIFTANWCKYCTILKKYIADEDIQKVLSKYDAVVEVDIDKFPETKRDWDIKGIPDFFIVTSKDNVNIKTIYRWKPPRNWANNEVRTKKYLLEIFEKYAPKTE